MELTHRFSVPTSVAETWEHFGDIAAVAECFPGGAVESVEGDTFAGTVKVKLGPIALTYRGSGEFTSRDPATHTFTVAAKGKDKRGNGTAGADVRLTMSESADGTTDVEVVTDLAVTGKPAQFGRSAMQDVSDKLLGQFVACLEQRLASEPDTPPEAAPTTGSPGAQAGSPASPGVGRHAAPPPTAPAEPDSIDLGATVLPVLMKSYGKKIGAAALVIAVLVWLKRR